MLFLISNLLGTLDNSGRTVWNGKGDVLRRPIHQHGDSEVAHDEEVATGLLFDENPQMYDIIDFHYSIIVLLTLKT